LTYYKTEEANSLTDTGKGWQFNGMPPNVEQRTLPDNMDQMRQGGQNRNLNVPAAQSFSSEKLLLSACYPLCSLPLSYLPHGLKKLLRRKPQNFIFVILRLLNIVS